MPDALRSPAVQLRALTFLVFATGVSLLALDQGLYGLVERQRVGVALFWGCFLAAATGLIPRSLPRTPGIVAIIGLAAFGAWTAASLSWTASKELTLTETARVSLHLAVLLLVAVGLDARTWRSALGGIGAGAAIVCGIALGSRLTLDASSLQGAEDARRLFQPFGYWNAVGAWAAMTCALLLAASAHTRTLMLRSAALASLPVAGLALGLTYSRAALGAALLAIVVTLLLSGNRWTAAVHAAAGVALTLGLMVIVRSFPEIAEGSGTEGAPAVALAVLVSAVVGGLVAAATLHLNLDRLRLSRGAGRATMATFGVLALVAASSAAVTLGPQAWNQFQTTAPEPADPADRLTNLNTSRYGQWRVAFAEFRDQPGTGTGAGTFEYSWNQRGDTSEFVRDAHSLYLEALSELGVPGLLALIVFIAGIAGAVATAWLRTDDLVARGLVAGGAGAMIAWCVGAGVDWLWESTGVTLLMLSIAGTLLASQAKPARGPRVVSRVVVASVAIVGLAVQLPGLVSVSEVRVSQRDASRGETSLARAHASTAIETQPWASTPYVQRALVEEQALQYDAAAVYLRRAEARDPDNWRLPLLLARVEARAGRPAEALEAFRRARELRPLGDFVSLK